jgi:hypothetical protein
MTNPHLDPIYGPINPALTAYAKSLPHADGLNIDCVRVAETHQGLDSGYRITVWDRRAWADVFVAQAHLDSAVIPWTLWHLACAHAIAIIRRVYDAGKSEG